MCFAEDSVSNADLNHKLDLILQKVDGLEERVTLLESDNKEVKQEVEEVAKSAKEAKSATESLQIPQDKEQKKSFLNKLRIDLKSEEVKSRGAWTKQVDMERNEKKHDSIPSTQTFGKSKYDQGQPKPTN